MRSANAEGDKTGRQIADDGSPRTNRTMGGIRSGRLERRTTQEEPLDQRLANFDQPGW